MRKGLAVLAVVGAMVMIGCGSTNVYTQQKTILHKGVMYNIGAVQRVSSSIVAKSADGTSVDVANVDKSGLKKMLEESRPLVVVVTLLLDDQEVQLAAHQVDSWSTFKTVRRFHDDQMEKVRKFMAEPKKAQLKLD